MTNNSKKDNNKVKIDNRLSAYQYDTSIKHAQDFLLYHLSSKISLVIIYVDIVGSTKMSMTLPVDKLVTIIIAFSHEISSVIESYDGYILKYVGDAVIAFFASGNHFLMNTGKNK
jgi:adenylate cyclase